MARRIRTAARRASGSIQRDSQPLGDSQPLDRCINQWIEDLERRQLLATIGVINGALIMEADALTTKIIVDYSSSDKTIIAGINTLTKTYPAASVTSIKINGSDNPEYISVSNTLSIPASIHGAGGNDTIFGGGGNDHVWGEDGNDSIAGRDGSDFLYGGNGNDTIDGSNGTDTGDGGLGSNAFISVENITGGLPVNPPPITAPLPKPPTPTPTPTPAPTGSGTIAMANGVLTVDGGTTSTKITIGYESSDNKVTAQVNSDTVKKFTKTSVASIDVIGGAARRKNIRQCRPHHAHAAPRHGGK